MGKFDGVLIASDFDNTIVYTEDALYAGAPTPDISLENRAAIEHFMAGGGTFCVATGRAKPSFEPIRRRIPSNGPTILFNGAAISPRSPRASRRSAWSCITTTTPSMPSTQTTSRAATCT